MYLYNSCMQVGFVDQFTMVSLKEKKKEKAKELKRVGIFFLDVF